MKRIKIEEIRVSIRIANHHPVAAKTLWDRSIPDPQLIYILSGDFEYQEQNQPRLTLKPDDILFIEPNQRHRFNLSPTCEAGGITGVHFEFIPNGSWAAGDYRLEIQPEKITRVSDGDYLQQRFKQMAAVYESYLPFRKELVNAIGTEIVLILAAHWQTEFPRSVQPSQRIEAMLGYIRENLSMPLTRQSLAEIFNLSAGYVNQLFKEELGMSPTSVINRERAARAYQLIDRQGYSVTQAALAAGFQDPYYFSRVFKQVYAIPPSQVRSKRQRVV